MKPMTEPRNATMDLSDIRLAGNGKVSNGNMYKFVATSDGDSDHEGVCCSKMDALDYFGDPNGGDIQNRKLPSLPRSRTPESTGTG